MTHEGRMAPRAGAYHALTPAPWGFCGGGSEAFSPPLPIRRPRSLTPSPSPVPPHRDDPGPRSLVPKLWYSPTSQATPQRSTGTVEQSRVPGDTKAQTQVQKQLWKSRLPSSRSLSLLRRNPHRVFALCGPKSTRYLFVKPQNDDLDPKDLKLD